MQLFIHAGARPSPELAPRTATRYVVIQNELRSKMERVSHIHFIVPGQV